MFSSKYKKNSTSQENKKKPPPRPPPPDLSKLKSRSTYNLVQQLENVNLIDWSPPSSPKVERHRPFGGSASSSFSSSTSSLASSKKSNDYESLPFNLNWSFNNNNNNNTQVSYTNSTKNVTITTTTKSTHSSSSSCNNSHMVPKIPGLGPTIIRAAPAKRNFKNKVESPDFNSDHLSGSPNLPMPSIPPPSPPKEAADVTTPYGIALYDFPATYPGDLPLQLNDVVILLRRVNDEWLYGQTGDKEGMFPSNFVDIIVPLPEEEKIVTAIYEFHPQVRGDLTLIPGQKVKVLKRISDDWLYGESNGTRGQFPSNFVDRVPKSI